MIVAAVASYYTFGAASAYFGNVIAGGATAGFVGGAIATGSLKGAVTGAFTGAIFAGIGSAFNASSGLFETGGLGHIGSHAITGGILSDLQGGNFGHGFWAAGLTKAANVNGMVGTEQGVGWDTARIAVVATIGGTISKITGGKFGNGAVTAGFAQMLNGNQQAKTIQNKVDEMKAAITTKAEEFGRRVQQKIQALSNAAIKKLDLSADGQICAGPCLGGELDITQEYGRSVTIKSGFGLRASGGAGSDVTLYSGENSPVEGTLSTVNYGSAMIGPVGITYTNYALPGGSMNVVDLNLRYPGGIGANGGTGLKKW
jgi:hypothetical protein